MYETVLSALFGAHEADRSNVKRNNATCGRMVVLEMCYLTDLGLCVMRPPRV